MRTRRADPSWTLPAAAALAAVIVTGCEKPPPGGVVTISRSTDGGLLSESATVPPMPDDGGVVESWESAPWMPQDVGWIPYPGHVQLDIEHGLGREPQGVLVYLSFTPDGRNPGLAAGDLAQLRAVDETHVVVWNNTNGDYYARVVVF